MWTMYEVTGIIVSLSVVSLFTLYSRVGKVPLFVLWCHEDCHTASGSSARPPERLKCTASRLGLGGCHRKRHDWHSSQTGRSTGSIEDLSLDEIQYSIVFYFFKPKLSKTNVIMCGVCQREEPCQLLCAPFAKYTPDMLSLARNVNNFYCISDMIVHHHQHHCQQNYRHREHNTMWSTKIII